MNSCQLVGRMVADPEIKFANNGNQFAKFRIAVDRRGKTENGPTADFIPCTAFGKQAEFLDKYFKKGQRIGLTGHIQTGSYDDRDGKKVYTMELIVDSLEFVESKQSQNEQSKQAAPKADDGFMNIPDGIDEELPFS